MLRYTRLSVLYVRVSIFQCFEAGLVHNTHTYFLAGRLGFYFEEEGVFSLSHDEFKVKMIGRDDI